jgi:hypothetical protein
MEKKMALQQVELGKSDIRLATGHKTDKKVVLA